MFLVLALAWTGVLMVPIPPAAATPANSPKLMPVVGNFKITATWGAPSGGYHSQSQPAIDTAMPVGTYVYAAGSGTVSYTAVDNRNCNPDEYPNTVQSCLNAGYFGTRVYITHPDGTSSRYLHLSGIAPGISNGTWVSAGQLIAYSGNTGTSTGPHLHYEERNSSGGYQTVDTWVSCNGSTQVTYDNMQNRKNQFVNNTGYGCTGGTTPPPGGGPNFRPVAAVPSVDTNGSLWYRHWNGTAWQSDLIGNSVRPGSTPSLFFDPEGRPFVAYANTSASLKLAHWTGTAWQTDSIGVAVAANTSPSGWSDPEGRPFVAYANTSANLKLAHWTGTTWQTDPIGTNERLSSIAISNTVQPKISGTPTVGSTLSTSSGSWSPIGTFYTYQWRVRGRDIAGANSATYVPTAADVGRVITVRVTASKVGYISSSAESAETHTVVVGTINSIHQPTIEGMKRAGRTLTATTGTWNPRNVTLSYQWLRNGKAVPGAMGVTYVAKKADKRKRIRVRVTASRSGYATAAVTSAAK